MEVIVVEEHTSEYPNPIYLKQGDVRISVIAIARFGLFRSPDPAV
ncbi:hypothetical protein VCCP1035_3671, partial [Vibrio cholerae CP1035(8)]